MSEQPNACEIELIERYRQWMRENGYTKPRGWHKAPEITLAIDDYERLCDGLRPEWRFCMPDEDRVHFMFHGTVWLQEQSEQALTKSL